MIQELAIEDICEFIGGSQPPKSNFIYEPKEGYVRLIQTRDYKSDRFITFIPEEMALKKCDENDVMIGRYGPPVFQILRGLKGAYNVALMKAVPKDNIENDYLYYLLKQDRIFRYVDALSSRTGGQTGVDLDSLYKYPVRLPDKEYQKKVIALLKGIDDKVENNIKCRETIEKMIWEMWLHTFNPNKVDGEKPISSFCTVSTESINPFEEPDTEYKYYNIPDFDATGTYVIERGDSIKSNKYQVRDNDVLVSKLNPWFSRVVIVDSEAICSTEFVSLRCENQYIRNFIYAVVISEPFIAYCSTNATGTSNSHKRIDPSIMAEYKVFANTEEVVKFGKEINDYTEKIISIVNENRKLIEIRDFLLPMLMSGQVTIK